MDLITGQAVSKYAEIYLQADKSCVTNYLARLGRYQSDRQIELREVYPAMINDQEWIRNSSTCRLAVSQYHRGWANESLKDFVMSDDRRMNRWAE